MRQHRHMSEFEVNRNQMQILIELIGHWFFCSNGGHDQKTNPNACVQMHISIKGANCETHFDDKLTDN